MFNIFKFLASSQQQSLKPKSKTTGFTLIELLVAVIISGIVISSLLAFLVNIMTSERKERAKSNSEQEVQAALEYMVQDLQEAVYVYDAYGLNGDPNVTTQTPIRNQIPPVKPVTGCNSAATCEPVLVFWKRTFFNRTDEVNEVGTGRVRVGSVTGDNDAYVYSLVAYYLVKNPADSIWSNASRIARFEIRDGIPTNGNTGFAINPDSGFVPFDLASADTIPAAMNKWKSGTAPTRYTSVATQSYDRNNLQTLVDYIDDTRYDSTAIAPLHSISTDPTQGILDCRAPNRGALGGDLTVATQPGAQRIPANFETATSAKTSSFYACVNSTTSSVLLYLRGNALARLIQDPSRRVANQNNLIYLPSSEVRIFGRGFFGNTDQ
ncbi:MULTISPECIES: hormogonium polysaccharide secretion pseudopilin HpsC [Trichocoleus]|uniref:Hormogonium polysaccharide secretion pseudopilin HpsC n=1 Tax=Trichocoleus desertorum GB2-A4 TaxID=2933944 RepID=A0ABV0J521_9CYAN|nr:hormogonium polysaccharide secretion pseudopilin HpsC [Trichocoleus sp. FACHB-46]MBD1863676.1 type II secretion system protein [Trichocoleus sp. FACHB-46]